MSERDGVALVVGGQGGIGAALVSALREADRHAAVVALGRCTKPALDLLNEPRDRKSTRLNSSH